MDCGELERRRAERGFKNKSKRRGEKKALSVSLGLCSTSRRVLQWPGTSLPSASGALKDQMIFKTAQPPEF